MARPLRIEYASALYHVMSRGNERRPMARDDMDRQRRLEWLQRTVDSYDWELYAFCLMSNHDHLFLATPEANLSAGMQFLNSSYTSYFNRRHRRSGHLFQGRFKAHLVETQGHYLELSRYIHLNPCRAGARDRPQQYRWSRYGGYFLESKMVSWVRYDRVLRELGRNPKVGRIAYRKFVNEGLNVKLAVPRADAAYGLLIGSDAFVAKMRKQLSSREDDPDLPQLRAMRARPSLETIADRTANVFGVDAAKWRPGTPVDNASRAVAAYLARREYGYPAVDIAKYLGYSRSSSVAQAVARVTSSLGHLQRKLNRITRDLSND